MAGLSAHQVRIGGYDYEFHLLPVEVGHPLRWELIGLLGEPLIAGLGSMAAGKSVGDLDVDKLLVGLSGLFSRLDPRFVLRLQQTFVEHTRYRQVGGQWVDLSATWMVHFAGRYHELDGLTWAHLRANYLGFLDDSTVWQAVRRAGSQVLSAAQSRSTSASTGTSGASSVASASQ
jgi:hypothetical protein